MTNNDKVEDTSYKLVDEYHTWKALIQMAQSSDAFGVSISETTRSVIDQPATLPTNRERHRFFVDTGSGYTRVNNPIEDGTNSFTDNKNHFLIQCPAGERREFRTAERATYQSGYEAEWGIAWRLAQNLGQDQVVRVRLIDTPREDALQIEYRNNGGTIEAEAFLQVEAGEKTGESREVFTPHQPLTNPRITKGFSNFYAVGRHKIVEDYTVQRTSDNKVVQKQVEQANIADSGDWSLESFNFHMSVEVDCTASSSSLDVEVGTMQYKMRTSSPEKFRQKEVRETSLSYAGTNNNYEPVYAMRVDPDRDQVPVEIPGTEVTAQAGTSGEMVAVACFPDEVTVNNNGGTWDEPLQAAANDTVMQVTRDVTEIIDNTGTLSPDIDEINSNMRQVSISATSDKKATGAGTASTVASPLHPDEYLIFLVKTDDGSSENFDKRVITDENW